MHNAGGRRPVGHHDKSLDLDIIVKIDCACEFFSPAPPRYSPRPSHTGLDDDARALQVRFAAVYLHVISRPMQREEVEVGSDGVETGECEG